MYLIGFPLLVIPFAIYNMIAFLMPGLTWTDQRRDHPSDLRSGLDGDAGGHPPGVLHPAARRRGHQGRAHRPSRASWITSCR